jgi:hypothetical protein
MLDFDLSMLNAGNGENSFKQVFLGDLAESVSFSLNHEFFAIIS